MVWKDWKDDTVLPERFGSKRVLGEWVIDMEIWREMFQEK